MHNLRWSFHQAAVMCFVGRDSLWRIMVADGMLPKLLTLIKAYYASTKMWFLPSTLLSHIIN